MSFNLRKMAGSQTFVSAKSNILTVWVQTVTSSTFLPHKCWEVYERHCRIWMARCAARRSSRAWPAWNRREGSNSRDCHRRTSPFALSSWFDWDAGAFRCAQSIAITEEFGTSRHQNSQTTPLESDGFRNREVNLWESPLSRIYGDGFGLGSPFSYSRSPWRLQWTKRLIGTVPERSVSFTYEHSESPA